jgi:hypothetical protein
MTLDNRIANAFNDGAQSGDITALIADVEVASVEAERSAGLARTRALDPALSAREAADARRAMEDAAFRRERLQAAVSRLRERLYELRAGEEDQHRRVIYEEVKAERDQLAAELASIYPDFAQRLGDLMGRIVANDREIEWVNSALPRGKGRLLVAELVARGLGGFVRNGLSIPSITQQLRLPSFGSNIHEPYAWPPTR